MRVVRSHMFAVAIMLAGSIAHAGAQTPVPVYTDPQADTFADWQWECSFQIEYLYIDDFPDEWRPYWYLGYDWYWGESWDGWAPYDYWYPYISASCYWVLAGIYDVTLFQIPDTDETCAYEITATMSDSSTTKLVTSYDGGGTDVWWARDYPGPSLVSATAVEQCAPPGPTLNFSYTMFILLDHVQILSSDQFFSGDNKDSHTSGSNQFRIQQNVSIQIGARPVTISTTKYSGESHLYDSTASPSPLSTSPNCYRKNCTECAPYNILGITQPITYNGKCIASGAAYIEGGQAAGMNTIEVASGALAPDTRQHNMNETIAYFTVKGNPVIALGPDIFGPDVLFKVFAGGITWVHTIIVYRNIHSGALTYHISGEHDAFPYHDMKINNSTVYTYDPIPNGKNPLSLLPPASNVNVTKSGALP